MHSAWKFTPDSVTGKRLMARCRQLLQENEEIGKMVTSGRLAKLEGELSMQKALCEEMKKNQVEMDDFVQELDDDMEGMQSTIYFLQQQLKEAKETIANLEAQKSGTGTEVLSYNPDEIPPDFPNSDTMDTEESTKDVELEKEGAGARKDHCIKKQLTGKEPALYTENESLDDMRTDTTIENYSKVVQEKEEAEILPTENTNEKSSELDVSLQDESMEDENEESAVEGVSTQGASEPSTSTSRGRGRRGTPTKVDKPEGQTKGRRSQRTTRGQKRAATNVAEDEREEKDNEEDGTKTTRPKRTRVAPQRFVTKEDGVKRKKTNSEGESIDEQDDFK